MLVDLTHEDAKEKDVKEDPRDLKRQPKDAKKEHEEVMGKSGQRPQRYWMKDMMLFISDRQSIYLYIYISEISIDMNRECARFARSMNVIYSNDF